MTRGVQNVLGLQPSNMGERFFLASGIRPWGLTVIFGTAVGTSLFDFAGQGEMGDVMRRCTAGEGVSVQSRMKGQNGFIDVVTSA